MMRKRLSPRRKAMRKLRYDARLGNHDALTELHMVRAVRKLSHAIGDAIIGGK